ncbi:hypothetical protein NKG05_08090 [Oerskovia sp. M15]
MTEADDALSLAWRDHWARLLAMLIARYRRPDLAEDALADAFAAAARTWPTDGVPDAPAAWLRTAAAGGCSIVCARRRSPSRRSRS